MTDKTLWLFHVDDEEDDRFFVARAVSTTGLPIVLSSAESGALALSMLQAFQDWPHIVLLDIRMPSMSGFEFLEELKALAKGKLPLVIMLSSSEQDSDVERAREMGAHAYCVKPSGLEGIVAFVSRLYHSWLLSEVPCEWPSKS